MLGAPAGGKRTLLCTWVSFPPSLSEFWVLHGDRTLLCQPGAQSCPVVPKADLSFEYGATLRCVSLGAPSVLCKGTKEDEADALGDAGLCRGPRGGPTVSTQLLQQPWLHPAEGACCSPSPGWGQHWFLRHWERSQGRGRMEGGASPRPQR